MMLFDSNLVIYSTKPDFPVIRELIRKSPPPVSAISVVEVLGYHGLVEWEIEELEAFFIASEILAVTDEVIDRAVALRQRKRMKLGDAIIAATALVHSLELYTRNTQDFAGIPGLICINPIPPTP